MSIFPLHNSIEELSALGLKPHHVLTIESVIEQCPYQQGNIVVVRQELQGDVVCLTDYCLQYKDVRVIVFLNKVTIAKALYQLEEKTDVAVCFVQPVDVGNIVLRSAKVLFLDQVHCDGVILGHGPLGSIEFKARVEAQLIVSYLHNIIFSGHTPNAIVNFNDQNHRWSFEDCRYDLIDMIKPTYFDHNKQCDYQQIIQTLLRGDSILNDKPWYTKLERRLNQWFIGMDKSTLDLSYLSLQSLRDIPEIYRKVGLFDAIVKLVLTGNRFKSLLPNLLLFSKVNQIYLNSCGIRLVPRELVKFEQLEVLSIEDNFIEDLHYSAYLPQLHVFNAARCSFPSFPQVLKHCKNLRHLDLSNQAQRPVLILNEVFPALQFLDLSLNYLSQVVVAQPSLQVLKMNYCNGAQLSKGIFGCVNLVELAFIGWDDLLELPEDLTRLSQLESLSFTINYLRTDSLRHLEKLPALKHLHIKISANHFRTSFLAENLLFISELRGITTLYIESAFLDPQLEEMFSTHPSVQKMYWMEQDQPKHIVTLFDKTRPSS